MTEFKWSKTMPVTHPPVNMANEHVENIQPAVAIETSVLLLGHNLQKKGLKHIYDAGLFARLGSMGPKRPIAIPLAIFIKITPTSRATSFFFILFSKLKFKVSTKKQKNKTFSKV